MQRHPLVGAVHGLAPPAGHPVEVAAQADEGGDVGDGVPDAVPAAVPLQVHRLVEVHRAGRVEGEEGQVGLVEGRDRGLGADPFGLGERRGGVGAVQPQLGADGREPGAQRLPEAVRDRGVGGAEDDDGTRHGPNLAVAAATGRAP